MKHNSFKIGFLILSVFLLFPVSNVFATDYDYYDVMLYNSVENLCTDLDITGCQFSPIISFPANYKLTNIRIKAGSNQVGSYDLYKLVLYDVTDKPTFLTNGVDSGTAYIAYGEGFRDFSFDTYLYSGHNYMAQLVRVSGSAVNYVRWDLSSASDRMNFVNPGTFSTLGVTIGIPKNTVSILNDFSHGPVNNFDNWKLLWEINDPSLRISTSTEYLKLQVRFSVNSDLSDYVLNDTYLTTNYNLYEKYPNFFPYTASSTVPKPENLLGSTYYYAKAYLIDRYETVLASSSIASFLTVYNPVIGSGVVVSQPGTTTRPTQVPIIGSAWSSSTTPGIFTFGMASSSFIVSYSDCGWDTVFSGCLHNFWAYGWNILFAPRNSSLADLQSSITDLKGVFPFSIFFDWDNMINDLSNNYSDSDPPDLTVPVLGNFTPSVTLLSANTLSGFFGESNYNYYMDIMKALVWIGTSLTALMMVI